MQMIIGSLLLMYCLQFSFIDRGDQYASFKKMKSQKYFVISRNTVLQFSVIWSFRKINLHLCARLHLAKVLVTGYNKYHHDIRY